MKRIKNAGKGRITEKIPRKLRNFWVSRLRHSCVYKYCYKSYWYYLLHNNKLNASKKIFTLQLDLILVQELVIKWLIGLRVTGLQKI